MKPVFKEDKATQVAARFLSLRGGKMSHLKLMKLLYILEREALIRLNRPVTFDWCVSMNQGPVLSQILSLMHGEMQSDGAWYKSISSPENNEVKLLGDPGDDSLSEAEESIIEEIYEEHGRKSRWELVDYTHSFEEWQNPQGSSIKIEYKEILRAGGKTEAEIAAILDEIENLALMEMHLKK